MDLIDLGAYIVKYRAQNATRLPGLDVFGNERTGRAEKTAMDTLEPAWGLLPSAGWTPLSAS
jgi:hypothetical protein